MPETQPSPQPSPLPPPQPPPQPPQTSPSVSSSYPWTPGIWVRLPWSGLGALVGAVLSTVAAVVVLAVSNGSSIENWQVMQTNIQPQVWVSIFTTLTTIWLDFALVEALTIRFWKQAYHGTMLRKLHDSYKSQSIFGAIAILMRGRLNAVAIACIFVTASVIRGPLFQRASTVDNRASQSLTGDMEIEIAQFFPVNYFGTLSSTGGTLTPEFKRLIVDLTRGASLKLNHTPCGDTCTMSVKGIGFGITCESSSYSFNVDEGDLAAIVQSLGCSSYFDYDEDTPDRNRTFCRELDRRSTPNVRAKVFAVGFQNGPVSSGSLGISSGINITTAFKDTATCKGIIPARRCTLLPGITEYAVVLRNDTISLQHPHWQNDTFLQELRGVFGGETVFGGAITFNPWQTVFPSFFPPVELNLTHGPRKDTYLFTRYGDCAEEFGVGSNTSCSNQGNSWQQLDVLDSPEQYRNQEGQEISCETNTACACNYTWRDPMQDMLDRMREVAFRVSIGAANANRSKIFPNWNDSAIASATANWTQRVPYTGTQTRTVFRTNWAYVSSGIVLSLAGILAILPLYHGWWELGRSVSLNPLETAKAFGAPLFEPANSNADEDQIVKEVGGKKVRYGVVEEKLDDEDESRRLLRIDPDEQGHVITNPEPGAVFV